MDYGGGDHQNARLGLRKVVWLEVKVSVHGLGLMRRLKASPVCDAQRR